MNEQAYISELSRLLSPLPVRERLEILDDYRQHFRDGRSAGESDAQIILRLGSPVDVAAGFFDEDFEPYEPIPAQSGGIPRWVKALICAVGGLWLIAALVLTLNLYIPRSYITEYSANGVPMATSVEMMTIPYIDSIRITDEMMQALKDDIEEIILDAGRTSVANFDLVPSFDALEQYAQSDWSNWIVGQVPADTEEVNETQYFEGVKSISVVGAYNMSCSLLASNDTSLVSVTVTGQLPLDHCVNIEMNRTYLEVKYLDRGFNVNLPTDSTLHVTITVPASWIGTVDISTMSGSIFQESWVNLAQVDVKSISGSIRLDGVNNDVRATSVSGEIMLFGKSEHVAASTVSGGIEAILPTMPESMTLSSVSGDISVFADGKYGFEWNSVSGALFNNGDGVQGRSGSQYRFSTVSGDVRLEFYTN